MPIPPHPWTILHTWFKVRDQRPVFMSLTNRYLAMDTTLWRLISIPKPNSQERWSWWRPKGSTTEAKEAILSLLTSQANQPQRLTHLMVSRSRTDSGSLSWNNQPITIQVPVPTLIMDQACNSTQTTWCHLLWDIIKIVPVGSVLRLGPYLQVECLQMCILLTDLKIQRSIRSHNR